MGRMGPADGVPKDSPQRSQVRIADFLEREDDITTPVNVSCGSVWTLIGSERMSALGQSRHIQRTPKTNFVRYAPNSDHSTAEFVCPLSATSGHSLERRQRRRLPPKRR